MRPKGLPMGSARKARGRIGVVAAVLGTAATGGMGKLRFAHDGDRLDGRQLHLRRGRALDGQRDRPARDALGDRSRRLRLRRVGCEYDPGWVYGASEDNDCHRSDVAPIRSAPIAVDEKVNLACSGAKAENIWRASRRAVALRRGAAGRPAGRGGAARRRAAGRADRGANDVGFGGLVADCALDWARSSPADPAFCRGGAQAEIEAACPPPERGLRKACERTER